MVATLALPDTIARLQVKYGRYMPPELQRAINRWTPQSLLGGTVKRALGHLPSDLAAELLDAIQRSLIIESMLAVARINGATGTHGDPGTVDDYGVVSRKVITTAGVTFLRDDWNNNGQDFTTFNFHGVGTTNTAEAVGDTALVAESTTALNPDNVRATGTRSVPSATSFLSVGTLTADASIAAVEHGLFSSATVAAGTLWDRSIFTVVNLASADSIQFSYTATLSAGG